jgi:hypothetical protein
MCISILLFVFHSQAHNGGSGSYLCSLFDFEKYLHHGTVADGFC